MALEQSLFQFVFNLASEPQQLAAFQSDPAGALDAAGLSDVSADDVREVLPLVADNLPATSGFESLLATLPVPGEAASGIAQLQAVASAVSSQAGAFGPEAAFGDYEGALAGGLTSAVDPAAVLGDLLPVVVEVNDAAIGAVEQVDQIGYYDVISQDPTGILPAVAGTVSAISESTIGFGSISDLASGLDSEVLTNAGTVVTAAETVLADPAGTALTLVESVESLASNTLTVDHAFALVDDVHQDALTVAGQVVVPALGDVAAGQLPLTDAVVGVHAVVADDVPAVAGQLGVTDLVAANPVLTDVDTVVNNVVTTAHDHLPLSTVVGTVSNVNDLGNGVLQSTGVSDVVSHSPLATAAGDVPGLVGTVSDTVQGVTDTLHSTVDNLDTHLLGH
ncbi:MAG TPA: IniB N-terminal domain-containing protein [Pseudonocardiaceae bacterium]